MVKEEKGFDNHWSVIGRNKVFLRSHVFLITKVSFSVVWAEKVVSSWEQIADKFGFNNNCPMREYNRKLYIVRTGGSFFKSCQEIEQEKNKFTIQTFGSMSIWLNGRLKFLFIAPTFIFARYNKRNRYRLIYIRKILFLSKLRRST